MSLTTEQQQQILAMAKAGEKLSAIGEAIGSIYAVMDFLFRNGYTWHEDVLTFTPPKVAETESRKKKPRASSTS